MIDFVENAADYDLFRGWDKNNGNKRSGRSVANNGHMNVWRKGSRKILENLHVKKKENERELCGRTDEWMDGRCDECGGDMCRVYVRQK
uniref:Uncharacterized protein n=1 Tax=Onchocerca volvulus TaxID=6282 RepID=A0A8R1TTA3_ONCVO